MEKKRKVFQVMLVILVLLFASAPLFGTMEVVRGEEATREKAWLHLNLKNEDKFDPERRAFA